MIMNVKLILMLLASAALGSLGSCSDTTIMNTLPAQRTEVAVNRWSPDHVWVPGHYAFRQGEYIWVKGYYRHFPRHRTSWASGHHRRTPKGKVWIDEHWK
jgi:hypothetical protein